MWSFMAFLVPLSSNLRQSAPPGKARRPIFNSSIVTGDDALAFLSAEIWGSALG